MPVSTTDFAASKSKTRTVVVARPASTSKPHTTFSLPLGIVAEVVVTTPWLSLYVTSTLTTSMRIWVYLPAGNSPVDSTCSTPVSSTRSKVAEVVDTTSHPSSSPASARWTARLLIVISIFETSSGGASVTRTSSTPVSAPIWVGARATATGVAAPEAVPDGVPAVAIVAAGATVACDDKGVGATDSSPPPQPIRAIPTTPMISRTITRLTI